MGRNNTVCRFLDDIYLNDTGVGCGYDRCGHQPFTQQQHGHKDQQDHSYSHYSYHHHGGVALDPRLGCTQSQKQKYWLIKFRFMQRNCFIPGGFEGFWYLLVKSGTPARCCSCPGCPPDSAPAPWPCTWCLGWGHLSGPSFCPKSRPCRWSRPARRRRPARTKLKAGGLEQFSSALENVFQQPEHLNEGEKQAQSTPSYFSAVHKLIAVIDVDWRSARQSPGQRQTGGAVMVQMDQRHLWGIWTVGERRKAK